MNGKNAGEYIVKNSFLKSYHLYAVKEYGNTIVSREFEVDDIIKEFKKYGVRVRVKEMVSRGEPMVDIETHYVVEDIERFKINVGK
jgi:hypothetical protein